MSISLTFNISSPTQTVMVPILNDMVPEDFEYFSLVLVSNDPAVTLNPATANITLIDDLDSTLIPPDICPSAPSYSWHVLLILFSVVTVGFNPTTYAVREDAGNVSVILSVLAGTLDRDVIVTLTTMNSTAMCECRKTLIFFLAY